MPACSSGEAGFSGPNSSRLTMTVGSPEPGRRWGVGDCRQLEPPVLLGLVVRVGRGLRRSAPVERTRPPGPAAGAVLWWLIIVDHPLATTPWRPGTRPASAGSSVETGSPWSVGRPRATLVISARWSALKVAGRPPR